MIRGILGERSEFSLHVARGILGERSGIRGIFGERSLTQQKEGVMLNSLRMIYCGLTLVSEDFEQLDVNGIALMGRLQCTQ